MQVETGGGFVQHQRLRAVHQGARDQDTARFARRHFVGITFRQMRDLEQVHHLGRMAFHFRRHLVVGPNAHAAEKAREDDFVSRVIARTHLHPVVGDDAQVMAQIEQMPAVAPQNAQRPGIALHARVQFARDDFDQRGFARAVGAENDGMLALRDGECDTVEHHAPAALYGDVLEIDEGDGKHRSHIVKACGGTLGARGCHSIGWRRFRHPPLPLQYMDAAVRSAQVDQRTAASNIALQTIAADLAVRPQVELRGDRRVGRARRDARVRAPCHA